jgi:uncharacterized repeat protein (TIGR01451 family)
MVFHFTVEVANRNGNDAARNVVVTDTLPAQLSFEASASDPRCSAGGGNTVVCNVSSISKNSTVTLDIAAKANGLASPATNSVSVTSDEAELNALDNTVTDDVNVVPSADLVLGLQGSSETINRGDNIVYTNHIVNNGPAPAGHVTVSTQLPPEMSFVPAASNPACSHSGGGLVVCDIGTLGDDASIDVLVGAKANQAAPAGTGVSASVISTDTADPTPPDASAATTTVIKRVSDLRLIRTATPTTVTQGDTFTVTYNVRNFGADPAENVVVTEPVPVNAASLVENQSDPDCSFFASVIKCEFGEMLVGANVTKTIVVRVEPDSATGFDTTATLSSDSSDLSPATNTVTSHLNVRPVTDLSLNMNSAAGAVPVGSDVAFQFTARNDGPSAANGVRIKNTLPAGLVFKAEGSDPGCSVSSGTVTCLVGDLPRSGKADITVVTTTTAQGAGVTRSNRATVDGAGIDRNQVNNTSEANVTIQAVADLAVVLDSPPPLVAAGDPITYAIDVSGNGPSNGENVRVIFPVPPGTTFDPEESSSNCAVGTDAVVTCQYGIVASGTTMTRKVVLRTDPAASGAAVATFTVLQAAFDPEAANNTATASTTIQRPLTPPVVRPPAPAPSVPPAKTGKKSKKKKKKKKSKKRKRRR